MYLRLPSYVLAPAIIELDQKTIFCVGGNAISFLIMKGLIISLVICAAISTAAVFGIIRLIKRDLWASTITFVVVKALSTIDTTIYFQSVIPGMGFSLLTSILVIDWPRVFLVYKAHTSDAPHILFVQAMSYLTFAYIICKILYPPQYYYLFPLPLRNTPAGNPRRKP